MQKRFSSNQQHAINDLVSETFHCACGHSDFYHFDDFLEAMSSCRVCDCSEYHLRLAKRAFVAAVEAV